jgi:hypothetical protein
MPARIIAAGIAVALIVVAWQAGVSLKNWAETRTSRTVMLVLPGSGRLTCQFRNGQYVCTPHVVIPPSEPVVAGAR